MCSITEQASQVDAASFSVLVAHAVEVGETLTAVLAEPAFAGELGGVHADGLASLATALLAVSDRASAAAASVVGQLEVASASGAGRLVGGKYASTRRFLEVEAGLSEHAAKAVVGRARDLRDDYRVVADAWLAGEVSGDAVREMTLGIRRVLRHVPIADRSLARDVAVDTVLPVAKVGTITDLRRVRTASTWSSTPTPPSGAFDATRPVADLRAGGSMSRSPLADPWGRRAVMTVLERKVDAALRSGAPAENSSRRGWTRSPRPGGA
jgi:hypothetical protein